MKKHTSCPGSGARIAACLIAPFLTFCTLDAPDETAAAPSKQGAALDQITLPPKDGFTLTLNNEVSGLPAETEAQLVSAFYNAMLKECADFDWACSKNDTLNIVASIPDCGGVKEAAACTGGNTITVNFSYLKDHLLDTEIVTHEAMHILQNYGGSTGSCAYWREGLADFARDRYGNAQANNNVNWSLKQGNSYTDSYDKTGHFLRWIAQQYSITSVAALHRQLKTGSCPDDAFWKDNTKLGLDELWAAYVGKKPVEPNRTVATTAPTASTDSTTAPAELTADPAEPTADPAEPIADPTEPTEPGDEEQPAESPPDEELPAESPPDEELPAESPPDEELPAESPPDEELPADSPPDEEQPAESPPDEELPADYQGDEGEPEKTLP